MASAVAQPVAARDIRSFDIPAGRVADAVVALGTQAGISIGISGSVTPADRAHAVRGRFTVDQALRRLLDGTRLSFVRIDDSTYSIVGIATPKHRAPPAIATLPIVVPEIIVTASKRNTRLRDFPGTVSMLDADSYGLNNTARNGTQAIVDAIPALASTHLGPGRNKLIIRGIADSSFTGPTQAIVGQYLGDIRLNYNAPDPDLNLYDMASVEVLEGPQGTLYGAGSLGGIVRLVPNAPDLGATSGSIAAGLGGIHNGGMSNDVAGMINLPIKHDVIGIRAILYRSIDGGYIRDARRGLDHINRSGTQGGRFDVHVNPGDGWKIDIGATIQDLNNDDAQYAEKGLPRYTRRSAIGQPFDNDYRLGQLAISKSWGDLTLLSATGVVRHDVTERFDATGPAAGRVSVFNQNNHITLFSNETRLSKEHGNGTGWLLGTTIISNGESLTRDLGDIAAPIRIAGVHNAITQGAIYGEISAKIGSSIIVTGGGRIAYSRLADELLDVGKKAGEPNREEVEVLPSIAVTWRSTGRLTAFLRYQEGFRPGGLSVSASGSGVASQRYQGDSISTYEAGARLGDEGRDRFAAALTVSYGHWEHIQADLVDSAGLPFTANLGTGRILGIEAKTSWRIAEGFALEAGLFLNDSELTAPDPGFENALHAELPDVAEIGGRLAFSYSHPIGKTLSLSAQGSVRYFGHSRLGVGPQLDIEQGNYADTSLNTRLGTDRIGISIDVANLLNAARNRFSLGNPFGVMNRTQITPQQPRTVRIGFDAKF